MTDRSDDALMEATASGDESAFRVLVERWERRVLAFFYRTLGSREEAQDLTQETFLRVFGHAADYEGRGRFGAWLFRIAGNLARNEIRRRSVRRFLSLNWFAADEADSPADAAPDLPAPDAEQPDRRAAAAEEMRRVHNALLALPERQRVAIVLKRFEGFTQEEIAEAMGIGVKAVEALLVRATATLRKRLR